MTVKYEKLKTLLMELFQLDEPDLDFGIYRVLHARSAEISKFLDEDLLPQVRTALEAYQPADRAALVKEIAELRANIEKAELDPEQSPKLKELQGRLSESVDVSQIEGSIYDHLFSFFRRYYSEGDFLSKRVYKDGVYAIPYSGEEVKLHWANADQYYIKTSEYLRDYAFRLRPGDEADPMRVHFRLVDATEGEHGNVKAAEGKGRVFVLTGGDFMTEEDGELVIRFEYRPSAPTDARDGGAPDAKPPVQKELLAVATERVLACPDPALARWVKVLGETHVTAGGERTDYTRLRAHLNGYTKRNTFDYFIHKDLGGFLRRELDFYIKNEVMRLDDIENETAARVEQYLSKIKVIRRIAGAIIDFLAQIENFQKRLWLKKKFVVETSYCITLGQIPEEFYPEIAANDAQREEWVELFAIDEIEGNLASPGYSVPLTAEFLKAHPTLVVDTRHFGRISTERILETVVDVECVTDGTLFQSENYQALSLMPSKLHGKVKRVYIDPPYNTGNDGFVYKDEYQHSTWMAMIYGRLEVTLELLSDGNLVLCSIDRDENRNLLPLLFVLFGEEGFVEELVWQKAYGGGSKTKWINNLHEYIPCFTSSPRSLGYLDLPADEGVRKYYRLTDDKVATRGKHRLQPLYSNSNDFRDNLTYPLPLPSADPMDGVAWEVEWTGIRELLVDGALRPERVDGEWQLCQGTVANRIPWKGRVVRPEKQWQWKWERTRDALINDEIVFGGEGDAGAVSYKQYQFGTDGLERRRKPGSILVGPYTQSGTKELFDLFGAAVAKFPKPLGLIQELVGIGEDKCATTLDFFAGTGTTGHAIMNLNRSDGGCRKFVLVESSQDFDSVLLPRTKKVTYAPEWKDGKPKRLATAEEAERGPRIVKVVRLESYEDALNNLELRRSEPQQRILDGLDGRVDVRFREQYFLRYMLDVESRGSTSLLNISAFTDPTAYVMSVKRPGSDESRVVNVDLLETFNWLIGLTVRRIAAARTYSAAFRRDGEKRLRLDGELIEDAGGPFWFRTVTGTLPDGRRALVIWRKRPGGDEPEGIERDNLVLDEWFVPVLDRARASDAEHGFDVVYVNGDTNLESLRNAGEVWTVRLIEEDFLRLMFDTEGA